MTAAQNCEIFRSGNELWIVLKGKVALDELDALKKTVSAAIVRGLDHVFVDLQLVDLVDSAMLGVLINFKMAAKLQGSTISLVDPNKNVKSVLEISRLDGIFELLSGPDGDSVRKRLVQPAHRQDSDPGSATQYAAPPIAGSSEHFPHVTSEGSFRDEKSEAAGFQEQVEEQCRRAVESMRQGDYETSITAYKTALDLDPDYLPALNNLAIVYEKQPVWHPMAIDVWQRVLTISRQRHDDKHMKRAERHLADLSG